MNALDFDKDNYVCSNWPFPVVVGSIPGIISVRKPIHKESMPELGLKRPWHVDFEDAHKHLGDALL